MELLCRNRSREQIYLLVEIAPLVMTSPWQTLFWTVQEPHVGMPAWGH